MEIAPDTKNWTWVLERACPDCGFVASEMDRDEIGSMIRSNAAAWQGVLARTDASRRFRTGMWSPLEYGCHVRDVYRIFELRLDLMLTEDDPEFANWDQDVTAAEDAYATQEPARVAAELDEAGRRLAVRFDAIAADQWTRPARRSDGSIFTVDSLGRYAMHDLVHHMWDLRSFGIPMGDGPAGEV